METKGLLPGKNQCPEDVFLPGWTDGRDSAMDVTVVCLRQAALVAKAAATSGAALAHAHDEKMKKFKE